MKEKLRKLVGRLVPSGDIVEQTVQSGIWMSVMNIVGRVLQLSMVVILAALLEPAQFGLMGITLLVLSALQNFSTLGLDAAAISREEDNINKYIDTIWGIELIRGGVLAGLMVLIAPVIADVFNEPKVLNLVRFLALSPIFVAVRNPAIVYFQKDLNFHLEFVYQISGTLVRFVVSVGWALVSPTVFALVAGLLAAEFFKSVLSFVAHNYKPRPALNVDRASELINYGKWVTGNSILYFLYGEGDDAIVGWLVSATALGYYQTAYRLSNAPATEISQVIGRVMFPAFSKVQNDVATLRQAYYRTLQMTMFIACPMAFGIIAIADLFVLTFIGSEWSPMITVMKILAVYGLMRSFASTVTPLWKAIDRPDYVTKISAVRVTLLGILIIPVTSAYGIEGTAALIVGIYVMPMLPLNVYITVNMINGSYRRILAEAGYPLLASTLMFGIVETARRQAGLEPGVSAVIGLVALGVAVYTVAAFFLIKQSGWGIEENLQTVYKSIS